MKLRPRVVYPVAGAALFLVIVLTSWRSVVGVHETIYLLGSRRVADPSFLSADFTWSKLPPTSFLFDHLVAPLWLLLDELAIANVGRFVTWLLMAASIAALARALRLPAWGTVAGFAAWLVWGQTFTTCGAPLEGFQVKSFAYPLVFFSLAFAMRGHMVRAGLASGLATAFHVIVGGWGFLAILASLLFNRFTGRRPFSWRSVGVFVLSTLPFVVPLLAALLLFQVGGASAEESARMDEIYVTFAAPHCCDFDHFMNGKRWARAAVVFSLSSILAHAWVRRRGGRVLFGFVAALALFFLAGALAQRFALYSVLKLFPGQLGSSLPALVVFLLVPAFAARRRPLARFGKLGSVAIVLAVSWLLLDRGALADALRVPTTFWAELRRPVWGEALENERLYRSIRTTTPRDAVFITPFLRDFWPYAERAQVASIRHPPFDRRLIEWKERLEALHGFRPYAGRGTGIVEELDAVESRLSVQEIVRIRDKYGATHYVTRGKRVDLADRLLFSTKDYAVYDIVGLESASVSRSLALKAAMGRVR